MYTRLTTTGGRTYLQIVEAFRTETGAARQRVIANLGRLDRLEPKDLDPLIMGLNRALGRSENPARPIVYEPSRAYGHLQALDRIWEDVGLAEASARALRGLAAQVDAWALLRAMVFHRLCDPANLTGLRAWLASVAMPEPSMPEDAQGLAHALESLVERMPALDEELERALGLMQLEADIETLAAEFSRVRAARLSANPSREGSARFEDGGDRTGRPERRGPNRPALDQRIDRMAAVLHQIIARRLHSRGNPAAVEDALQSLAGIQQHRIRIGEHLHQGITQPTPAQTSLMADLQACEAPGAVQAAAQMPERRRRPRSPKLG